MFGVLEHGEASGEGLSLECSIFGSNLDVLNGFDSHQFGDEAH